MQGEFEEEVKELIEWCDSLDFDKYIENWATVATSGPSDGPILGINEDKEGDVPKGDDKAH